MADPAVKLRGGEEGGGGLRLQAARVARMLLLLLLGASGGCSAPAPGADPLPRAALDFLRPGGLRVERVADGVWYREIRSPVGPWVVHLLEADLDRCELGFPVVPGERQGWGPLARITDMLREEGVEILAAVNGDFFTREGRPIGSEIVEGRLRLRSPRPVFSWRADRDPWIGTPGFEGDSVAEVGWSLSLRDPDGLTHALGGFPELLVDGARVGDLQVGDRPDFAAVRHPRTAVALDPEGRRLWLVVVDGRQEGWSAGMTLPELTELLEGLGARHALNLDGGGSSVMIVKGRRVSRPSDGAGERAVVNGLAIRRDGRYCQVGRGPEASAPISGRSPP